MKYYVNDACIGCGLCASICPHGFFMKEAGVAEAVKGDINDTDVDDAQNACPVGAIQIGEKPE